MPYIEKTKWYKEINNFKHIMIFGAKHAASQTYKAVRWFGLDIDCYLVSGRRDNPVQLDGKPVKTFSDIHTNEKRNV